MKLLVNAPGGTQEIIEVGLGGGYYDASRVLWDERIDGPMPAVTPGGMVRAGSALEVDSSLLAAHQSTLRAASRAVQAAEIDAACSAIYARVGRFSEEYKLREAQALAYQSGGYTGDVPRQVAAFATPAGITAQQATTTILSQAAQYRTALDTLGELRMQKYAVLRAPSDAAAQAAHAQVMAGIAAIAAALG